MNIKEKQISKDQKRYAEEKKIIKRARKQRIQSEWDKQDGRNDLFIFFFLEERGREIEGGGRRD